MTMFMIPGLQRLLEDCEAVDYKSVVSGPSSSSFTSSPFCYSTSPPSPPSPSPPPPPAAYCGSSSKGM